TTQTPASAGGTSEGQRDPRTDGEPHVKRDTQSRRKLIRPGCTIQAPVGTRWWDDTATSAPRCISRREGLAVVRTDLARAIWSAEPCAITKKPSAFTAVSYWITLSFGTPM